MKKTVYLLLVLFLLLTGCVNFNDRQTGNFSLSLTDAPADLDEVNVTITRVELVPSTGTETGTVLVNDLSENPLKVNLLDLRFDAALLGEAEIPEGSYEQIRLILKGSSPDKKEEHNLADSNVVINGQTYPFYVPSGDQTGLKINYDLLVSPNTVIALLMDVNVADFVQPLGSNEEYLMEPTAIKVVEQTKSGGIKGKVVDAATGDPITSQDVRVIVRNDLGEVVAESLAVREETETIPGEMIGYFQVNALLEGVYSIEIISENYISATVNDIQVVAGEVKLLDTIRLSK